MFSRSRARWSLQEGYKLQAKEDSAHLETLKISYFAILPQQEVKIAANRTSHGTPIEWRYRETPSQGKQIVQRHHLSLLPSPNLPEDQRNQWPILCHPSFDQSRERVDELDFIHHGYWKLSRLQLKENSLSVAPKQSSFRLPTEQNEIQKTKLPLRRSQVYASCLSQK